MAPAKKRLVIIDGMAYAFRAFYAVPEMSTSTGIATNALYGFIGAVKRAEKTFKPDYAVVAFDSPGGSFRDEMLKEYKGHRDAPPEQLVSQFPLIEQVVPLLGWHLLKQTRMEADDVMATLTRIARKAGVEVIMMTSDKDMLQLVGDGVGCYRESFKGGSLYGPKEVVERFGIDPGQVQDLLGLMGDSADNIPGVPGVGEKTATKLLLEHGSIEKVLKAAPKMKPGKLMENLQEFADQARLSYKLAALKDDVDLGVSMKDLVAGSPNFPKLLPVLKQYELRTLLAEYGTKATTAGHDAAELSAAAPVAAPGAKGKGKAAKPAKKKAELRWKTLAAASTADLKKAGLDLAQPLGLALHPVLGGSPEAPTKLALGQEGVAVVLNIKGWPALHETLSHLKHPVMFDSKPLQRGFLAAGLEVLPGILDINVGGYLVNSTRVPRDLGEASILMGLNLDLPAPQEDLFEAPDEYLAKHAEAGAMVGKALLARFKADDLGGLYDDLEGPLIPLLAKMENDGIALDVKMLAELEVEAQGEMKTLHKKAIKAAGREFNLNSPSQLAEILFKELKLPPSKKTKTGYSTDNDVLEALAEQHPLPQLILDNRQLAKLSGTYLQALPRMVGADGRVHSNWNQTVAATGRLSSQDPNLQNIPVRTEWGSRIRKAFVPGKRGDSILTCDYSQIELRVLAHYCGDPVLKKAFQTGRDIHTETAARMFKVPTDKVTSEMRSRAKVINFGVLYGMGAFRISREFGTSVREGKSFLEDYFGQFPKVRAFLEECKEETRKHGYATTLLKRRRPIPEINSANRVLREQGERVSTNMPIQGTAADMIKKAMLDVDALLKKKKARTRMLLQVHDELVFELAKEEADSLPPLIQKAMEGAMKLDVPIQVEMGQGRSWFEAKH
jgi:DNA polymerase-1